MSAPTEIPTDPESIKKLEKKISTEAKAEEKKLQSAFTTMHQQERSEAKASKARLLIPKHVKKLEKQELETVKSLHSATHKHDQAVAGLHLTQADLQTQQRQLDKLKRNVTTVRQQVDQVTKDKHDHDRERSDRLSQLHSSPPPKAGGLNASTSGASAGISQERSS
ncbi:uncharacterized protein EDB91DRAFT_1044124 [Suillus paluster]|uniref:uncharacterized protein n=1 Tax=Suillus paluster TaxID=48578 RepID=UPI001B881BF8|nr:uncharacterized protein EDB91DRAFT_1044124 [Suillus paluster]KAG1753686.1 hypothetical protein EDB91DRAFT_1044124 [Suillus paluster]